jgi:transposase
MTYSLDLRRHVLKIKAKEGLTFAEVADRFKIGIASIVRWSKKIDPLKTRNKPATKVNMEALKQDVKDFPDAYQYERAKRLGVSQRAIGYALKRLKVTYKKNIKSSQSRSRQTVCVLSKP